MTFDDVLPFQTSGITATGITWASAKGKQKIHISYDLIGFVPVDVLTKAEQA